MKRIISYAVVTLMLVSLLAVPGFCEPYTVEISTVYGDFKVVINDSDLILKSLSSAELEALLIDAIETVATRRYRPAAIYFPDVHKIRLIANLC